ncbi:MAG: radical SAM protein [archaeon]
MNPYYSYQVGRLPMGCRHCVKGRKLVLFVTGMCPRHCFYCPISENKWQRDVVFADEWPVKRDSDIITEARLIGALGAGITGGDPLVCLDRTVRYIKMLKRRFGKGFHIHLYTPLDLVNKGALQKLAGAGLDEIRFHPDIEDDRLWGRIGLARAHKWDLGVEIPAIPGKKRQTQKMMNFLRGKIDFLNLNELEISDTNAQEFMQKRFRPKDRLSHGVFGSEPLALELLRLAGFRSIHYCTSRLKDKVQLANRIKNRAKSVKKEYDHVTEEGLLFRGAIYTRDAPPDSKVVPDGIFPKLRKLRNKFIKEYDIPPGLIEVDVQPRLLTNVKVAETLASELKGRDLIPALVWEYPTYDQFPVELELL